MNCKWKNIEDFKIDFYKLYPNSDIFLLDFVKNKHVKVQNKYGICIVGKQSLLRYGSVTIRIAVDKTQYFINQSKEIHGDKYNYDKVNWVNAHHKVIINCNIHGDFKQTPTTHQNKSGCPECGKILIGLSHIKSEKLYIKQLDKTWNGKYTIEKGTYINDSTKILHYCNIEKYWFLTKPSHILANHGCPRCKNKKTSKRMSGNPLGWTYSNWEKAGLKSKIFDGFKCYIIKCWDDTEEFYKIGKTFTKITRRFDHKKLMPYKWKIVKLFDGESREISELENKLKNMNKEHKYIPKIEFSGKHECFYKLKNYEELLIE